MTQTFTQLSDAVSFARHNHAETILEINRGDQTVYVPVRMRGSYSPRLAMHIVREHPVWTRAEELAAELSRITAQLRDLSDHWRSHDSGAGEEMSNITGIVELSAPYYDAAELRFARAMYGRLAERHKKLQAELDKIRGQQDDVLTDEQIRSVYPPYDEAWPAQRLDDAIRQIAAWRARRGM